MGTLTINNAACNVVIYRPEYGLLYNWYAATDARKISSSDDWVVPTLTHYDNLITYLGGASVAGGKCKETGTTYWSPNTGATNETGFNGRGNGYRDYQGVFSSLTGQGGLWTTSDPTGTSVTRKYYLSNTSADFSALNGAELDKKTGYAIRLIYVGAGTPTSYTGNDGKIYRVVTIGTQTWLADNLSETRFRNGDIIPWYGADPANYFTNAEWGSLTTAGCCAYDNDVNNVAPGFSFPT